MMSDQWEHQFLQDEKDMNAPIIAPTDTVELSHVSRVYWLGQIQPLRGMQCVEADHADVLNSVVIGDVDRIEIVTNTDCGCSAVEATILTMPTEGSIDGGTILDAVWAGYMLSLKATMDGGKNERAHIGDEPDAIEVANAIVERLGATATPCDEVYGSDGTYLELVEFRYEPATRTMILKPYIGS
jgi:hypothetical protein